MHGTSGGKVPEDELLVLDLLFGFVHGCWHVEFAHSVDDPVLHVEIIAEPSFVGNCAIALHARARVRIRVAGATSFGGPAEGKYAKDTWGERLAALVLDVS